MEVDDNGFLVVGGWRREDGAIDDCDSSKMYVVVAVRWRKTLGFSCGG